MSALRRRAYNARRPKNIIRVSYRARTIQLEAQTKAAHGSHRAPRDSGKPWASVRRV
ncbi:hypothetical protein BN2476_320310 [Paraburkholderia piptadeniae]|uniref:Uncharacterized protein n=1 Tax=Paraburkholderia piptadeniae TaxID=1701573 RepID=A0A1N7S708_9BURK|nr:hypothetical protein BN2476_320310 [Paraburkholderia piptadeniae]